MQQTYPRRILQQIAAHQGWIQRRAAYWLGVQNAYLRAEEMAITQQRIEELREAKELRDFTRMQLQPRRGEGGELVFPLKPRSYEGAVRAYCHLDTILETKREAVLQSLDPLLARSQGAPERKLPFSTEELRQMAHSLIETRRQRMVTVLDDDESEEADDDEADAEAEAQSPQDVRQLGRGSGVGLP